MIRWEAVALRLARAAGITVPRERLVLVDGQPVLIVERFDRRGNGERTGYASAMTMLERRDGQAGSYVEIAEVIEAESTATSADLAELWRRMALTVLIHNRDDHLRNHGFLRVGPGWRLAPAFDLNPEPDDGPLSTALADDATAPDDVATLMELAPVFRLDASRAATVLGEVADAVAGWPQVATALGLPEAEQRRMRPAFEQLESARRHRAGR